MISRSDISWVSEINLNLEFQNISKSSSVQGQMSLVRTQIVILSWHLKIIVVLNITSCGVHSLLSSWNCHYAGTSLSCAGVLFSSATADNAVYCIIGYPSVRYTVLCSEVTRLNIKHNNSIDSCWSWFILVDMYNCRVDENHGNNVFDVIRPWVYIHI